MAKKFAQEDHEMLHVLTLWLLAARCPFLAMKGEVQALEPKALLSKSFCFRKFLKASFSGELKAFSGKRNVKEMNQNRNVKENGKPKMSGKMNQKNMFKKKKTDHQRTFGVFGRLGGGLVDAEAGAEGWVARTSLFEARSFCFRKVRPGFGFFLRFLEIFEGFLRFF